MVLQFHSEIVRETKDGFLETEIIRVVEKLNSASI